MTAPAVLPDGYVLHAFASLGSTNDEARRLAEAGAADGQVVVAEQQTAGRGRAGRTWSSPPGNLYVSILLRPDRALAEFGQLSLLASIALADALAARASIPLDLGLKWPNDVLIRGRKVAGILLESGETSGGGRWVIVGCGVNVASAPEDVAYPATALAAEGAHDVTPAGLLEAYVMALEHWREIWSRAGFDPVREAWLARAFHLGGPIRLRLPKEEVSGRFADLSPAGALRLETADGTIREISAGDVLFGATP